ncbi:MAG: arsenosugar biosynthesis radical SAM (seleno)protein ArsS, partial [Blastocatellia bacterium]
VNLGKLCNQSCQHCYVDAGPGRTEIMSRETILQIIAAVTEYHIPVIDITGGAPELNPDFRYLVDQVRTAGALVLVRHNLTVMFEPRQTNLPEFFRERQVEVVSSLPYFLPQQTDAQRGAGVFGKSIEALQRLNSVGYGIDGTGLILNLVYNPVGAFLPPPQSSIEADFRREMADRYGVSFNSLFTITNMPINRFLAYLKRSGNEKMYMEKLVNSFNPGSVERLMCRTMISVDWTGKLFDCDFNQMVSLGVDRALPQTISEFDPSLLKFRRIQTARHCFGCTAGAGSSCGGSLVTG